jgi:hypothetical protein
MDAMTDHLFLTSEGLKNQFRYEAMINRQLNHSIVELERLQARGKGESNAGQSLVIYETKPRSRIRRNNSVLSVSNCELHLTIGVHAYEKEGARYLQRILNSRKQG